ncbi:MAG TPA: hypothetical protein ENN19_10730 [Chloroflexi bacterium]|nr:hypothetical protein [Chloroflexota bacterium]
MTNRLTKYVTVDREIFPISAVESALYVLGERIDGRIRAETDDNFAVTLHALEEGLDTDEMERAFNQALIAASVNERAFQAAAPIRNYLAQTALSITTESQQTIQEFASSLGNVGGDEHSGAPTGHVDIAWPGEPAEMPATGVQWTVDTENERVLVRLDGRRHLLPDVLWAAHEMRDLCPCSITTLPHGQLMVLLEPDGRAVDVDTLGERFERRLNVARERSR